MWQLSPIGAGGTIEGKRDRGRQRRVWADDVKNWSGSGSVGEAKRKIWNTCEMADPGAQPSV